MGPHFFQVLDAHYFFMVSLFFLIIIQTKVNRDIVSARTLTLPGSPEATRFPGIRIHDQQKTEILFSDFAGFTQYLPS